MAANEIRLARRQKTTEHYDRVKKFMQLAGQETPEQIKMPDEKTRILRAKIVLEEAFELIKDLGVRFGFNDHGTFVEVLWEDVCLQAMSYSNWIPCMCDVVDDCADLSVVTIGTLIACGVWDENVLREVDESNLLKFKLPVCPERDSLAAEYEHVMKHQGKGVYVCSCGNEFQGPYQREDGKWIKAPYFKGPDIGRCLKEQMDRQKIYDWRREDCQRPARITDADGFEYERILWVNTQTGEMIQFVPGDLERLIKGKPPITVEFQKED